MAKNSGLTIPIVYNTNAYEDTDKLKALHGLIDIYLPDFKYSDNGIAEKYSKIKNYKEIATAGILEMINQQPENIIASGVMQKGVIVRHLILPNNIQNTKDCINVVHS
jgi:putative pyruvate formate lyase activating enzyme